MKKTILLSVLLIIFTGVFAQKSDVLLTIGKKQITADEFKYIYLKNNTKELGQKSPEDYLDLFINFKLFVAEAEQLKMDTAEQFVNELQGYKDQLAHPFLTESKIYDELLKEAYENSKTDVKFDLIYIRVDKRADEQQKATAKAKADKIRSRIAKGEDFQKVARETSDQRSAAQNGGEYPFIPLSNLPYSLQQYLKTAKKGVLSAPIESIQGYYIVRLNEKRENPGRVQVAHIMVSFPTNADQETIDAKKQKADSIWQRLEAGDDYAELAKKYSDDKNSGRNGGEMRAFTSGRMVEPFEKAAFGLNTPGEYTKPVRTQFGYHILKLIKKLPPETFDEVKAQLRREIDADPERHEIIQNRVAKALKDKYAFRSHKENADELFDMLDSSIYKAQWDYDKSALLNDKVFSYDKNTAGLKDFAEYLKTNQRRQHPVNMKKYFNDRFDNFVYQTLSNYEKERLESENAEYANIVREYRDGMLLFEYKKKYIWDKAVEDSTELKKFYKKNKDRFQNNLVLEISVFEYSDDKAAQKFLQTDYNDLRKMTDEEITNKFGKKGDFKLLDSGEYAQGENLNADKVFEQLETTDSKENVLQFENPKICVIIRDRKKGETKEYNEIKGLVISEYQNYLENEKLKILKKKYSIDINQPVLKKLKSEL